MAATTTIEPAAVPATLCLHVPGQPASLRVIGDGVEALIGRGDEATVSVAHPSVSRRHALLWRDAGGWRVRDLGSTNGVRIGGYPVDQRALRHGQWFSLGDVFCEFRVVDGVELDALTARAEQRRQTSGVWLGRLERAPDREALLGGLIQAVVRLAECRRGFLLAGDMDRGFAIVARCDAGADPLPPAAFTGSTAVLARATHERVPVLVSDPSALDWARGRPSIVEGSLRALLAVPILHRDALLGVAYADSDEPGKLFTELDRDILGAFAAQAALILAARGLDAALSDLGHSVERAGAGHAPPRATGDGPAP